MSQLLKLQSVKLSLRNRIQTNYGWWVVSQFVFSYQIQNTHYIGHTLTWIFLTTLLTSWKSASTTWTSI